MITKKMRAMTVVLICMLLSGMAFASSAKEAWDGLVGERLSKNPAFAFVENDSALKNVLIYGDSISVGYMQKVRDDLKGKANVYRIHCNGGDSSSFIDKMTAMHKVMRDEKIEGRWSFNWDVIHFNVGLHDLKYTTADGKRDKKNGTQVISTDEYAENLKKIISYLNKLAPKAKLIFATTTPVPENSNGRFAGDARKYNKVALKVLKNHPQIVVNNLYKLTKPNQPKWWSAPGNVHFSEEGCNAQGDQVARVILKSLGRKGTAKKDVSVAPDKIVTYKTVEGKDGGEDELQLHIFEPKGHKASDKRPAIVFFFGGGWKGGTPKHFYPQSDYLSSRGMVAICVEYRTATSHGTPPKECVKDGKSAIRWVRKNAAKLGIDANKLAAGGGSAGGHVAAACGTVKGFNEEGEDTSVSCVPNALVLFNPVYDNSPEGYGYERVEKYWKQFSPMHNIDKDTPPTTVFLGSKDTLIPVATAEKYKELMEKAGVRCDLHLYKGQPHGFFNKAKFNETLQEADKFLVSLGYLKKKLSTEKLGFEEIVFVKRKPYSSDHYYTDINNGTSKDRFIPENGIYIYNLNTKKQRPVVTAADMPGGKGFIGKITLSFDAKKILFDFRENAGAGFRIWEVNTDGTGLRQVSFAPADEAEKAKRWKKNWHTDDIHPAYLPDGKIIFSSTRCEHTVLCGGSSSLVAPVLHRMDSDGKNVEQLSVSLVSEFCPVVLDDGRVMYHRWEYIDKGARVGKTIWSMNPDGSGIQEIYGVSDDTTTVYMYPQPIPGAGNKIVCVGTCHYPQGGCLGAIMLINPDRGSRLRGPDPDEAGYKKFDDKYAVTNITPTVFIERRTEPGWHFLQTDGKYIHDKNGTSGNLYTHPFPVSEKQFLVSYKVKPADHYKNVADAYSLYLIDTDGNHSLILKDENLSCWHPTPLLPRTRPAQINTYQQPEYKASNEAVCIVTNIYQGMEGVKPGEIKWLRINEAIPRYWDTGRRWKPATSSSAWKAALWPRVQWGIVPVEKDGSAHFKVPAGRNIFFQALDENFVEIQRERTYVNYKAGEIRSCTGCHGKSSNTPLTAGAVTGKAPMAVSRPASELCAQPCDLIENGGTGSPQQVIHYPTDIQPMFDAKCISCHAGEKPKGALMLTGDVTQFYNTSYEQLGTKELAGPIISEFQSFGKGDRGNYNGAELPAKSLGSHKSVIMDMLTNAAHPKNAKDDHSKMLTKNELMILARWVDSNYQFYGTYYGRQHQAWQKTDPKKPSYNPADFRRKPTFQEAISFHAPKWHK